MPNMTRDELVSELQVRGWSRFTATQLQKYLDWALQDIYGMARYPRSSTGVSVITNSVLDLVPFATISGAGAELVHQIKSVQVKSGANLYTVEPATEPDFYAFMYPNIQQANPVKAAYPNQYFVYNLGIYFYPRPNAGVDYHIHRLMRGDVFSGGTATSGLPERFDKVIVAQTEAICCRRAHDTEGFAFAQSVVRDFIMDELGLEGSQSEEQYDRVVPWRG
jgi:hypothetical protein